MFDKFGITYFCLKYSHPLLFNKSILLPLNVCRIAEWMANSVDPDKTPRSAASDLSLHCLFMTVCPNP